MIATRCFLLRERLVLILAVSLISASDYRFRQAVPGYSYSFPRDHFEHPEFRTEWWYYTGNVNNDTGRRFGFELVFFRQAQRRGASDNRSAWRVDDLYLAHLALTDVAGKRFLYHKRLNRAGPGIAGASFEKHRIWNGNWSAQWEGERQTLEATAENFHLTLQLTPAKPFVIHGAGGLSQKAAGVGRASHYVSFPRLFAEGEINGQRVRGTAWMDHEWFSHELDEAQAGWDWFSVQLDNGSELMLFELRRKDRSIDPYSAGTYVDAQGRSHHLRYREFSLVPVDYWTSPKTKARYPIRWKVSVPSAGISLECVAALPEQELISSDSAGPNYWEGAVTYAGSESGVGYLEMTGYDKPIRLD